jgi:uncharacterized YigZ family protein
LMSSHLVPARRTRLEYIVANSRFISTAAPAASVEIAKEFIQNVKHEFSDATHNVPAYVIGHDASLIAHCSDDGEPSGTAGRPALSVLQGSGIGDIAVVITRYFGGTKLGKGGLVQAYSDGVRFVLEELPLAEKKHTHTILISLPYNWIERIRCLVPAYDGQIMNEDFALEVTVTARLPSEKFLEFQEALKQASHGSLQTMIVESGIAYIPIQTNGDTL